MFKFKYSRVLCFLKCIPKQRFIRLSEQEMGLQILRHRKTLSVFLNYSIAMFRKKQNPFLSNLLLFSLGFVPLPGASQQKGLSVGSGLGPQNLSRFWFQVRVLVQVQVFPYTLQYIFHKRLSVSNKCENIIHFAKETSKY